MLELANLVTFIFILSHFDIFVFRDAAVATSPYRRQVALPGPTDIVCPPTNSAATAGTTRAKARAYATSTATAGASVVPSTDPPALTPSSTLFSINGNTIAGGGLGATTTGGLGAGGG